MVRFTDEEFARLVDYMAGNYGIDLTKKQTLAECRLGAELDKRHIGSLTELLRQIQADKTGQLTTMLMNRMTTNYTFFMREISHFNFLEDTILPAVDPHADSFQVWCAGCSTGEECYTLAMLLAAYRDRGNYLPPVQILATDISERALQTAEAAQYPLKTLTQLPELWRKIYCQKTGADSFRISPAIRSMVTFRKMNLMKPYAGQGRFDLILCRNVMIYFNDAARRQLTGKLYHSLKKGGYLFIGHTELLPRDQELFTYVCPAIYQKAKDGGR